MTANKITKRLTKDILIGLAINVICTFFFVQVVYSFKAGSFEGKQAVTIFSLLAGGWTVILTICSATVFLNVYSWIRYDKLYRFLTYYLVPVLVATMAATQINDSEVLPAFLVANSPFFIIQTIFFIRFMMDVNKMKTVDPAEKTL